MAYLPNVEHDVFISYAHIDNEPWMSERGWVDNFHEALERRLNQYLGAQAMVWRDARLQGNDDFSDQLMERLHKVGCVVSVLSPRYMQSEWCLREANSFLSINDGARVGNRSRLFKVQKTPVELNDQPQDLQRLLGYDFFAVDEASGRPAEYSQSTGNEADQRYWMRLDGLAYDLSQILIELKEKGTSCTNSDDPQSSEHQPTVYLATTTRDLQDEYQRIRRACMQNGYHVLPGQSLPAYADEIEESVSANVEQAQLTVHMVGEHYGLIPEESEQSIIEIQNRIAAEQAKTSLKRLIWIPPNLSVKSERQDSFIQSLRTNEDAQRGADVIESDLNELREMIVKRLTPETKTNDSVSGGGALPETVYLLYDEVDEDIARAYDDTLYDAGCEITVPLFSGDEAQREADHIETLKSCDAAIVVFANADEAWFRGVVRSIDEHQSPDRQLYFLLLDPENRSKQRFRTRRGHVLKAPESNDPEHLLRYLQEHATQPTSSAPSTTGATS